MQRLDLQFYALFMVILCGAALGLLSDLLRVSRGYYRPGRVLGAVADLLFWTSATIGLTGALFYGNWGELRFYVLLGLLIGIGLYYWLAGPLVRKIAWLLFQLLERIYRLVIIVIHRLFWVPLLTGMGLVWSGAMLLWHAVRWLCSGVWRLAGVTANWIRSPLVGPYRCMRLHYLLTKRRWKRQMRFWLFGPSRGKRWR